MSRAESRRWLLSEAWAQRWSLLPSMTGGLIRQTGFLAVPLLLQLVIDDGVRTGDVGAAAGWAAALVVAGLVQLVGMTGWDYYANRADARCGSRLRSALLVRLLGDRGRAQAVGGDGDLVLRAGRDVDAVRAWVRGLPTWVVIGTTVIVLVPGFFTLDPWLLAVALGTVPLLVIINRHYTAAYQRAGADLATAHGARADAVDHLLRSGLTTRGLGAEDVLRDRHHDRSAELTVHAVRSGTVLARWSALGEGVPAVAVAVGVAVGSYAVLEGRLSIGGLVAFAGWMATVGIAVQVGLIRLSQTVAAHVSAERLREVLADHDQDRVAVAAESVAADASLMGSALVLRTGASPLTLSLRPGELVVVIGPIGSGKSTLLRILAGWEEPVGGSVTYGGVPVSALSAEVIALVPQRPLALTDSVAVNLGLGAPVSESIMVDALVGVGLAERTGDGCAFELGDHHQVADGLAHRLADGATSLSGGQIQRLALARSLVGTASVILVDDVTSAVDPLTEQQIVTELRRRAADRIVVVTSHRAAVIAAADRVVTL